MNHRPERVSSLISGELGKIIRREIEFEDGVIATITGVDVDKELGRAIVFVSIFPSEKSEGALGILKKKAGGLQYLLMKKMNIKPMPRIEFEIDRGPENAARVEKALLGDNNNDKLV